MELRDQLTRSINKESFFDALGSLDLKEVREEDSLITDALASLHNEGVVDLNDQFTLLKRSDQNAKFYNLITIYCSVLPNLNCSVIDVINLYFHFKTEDMPTGSFDDSFFIFCKKKICRSKEAISYLLERTERQSNLLTHSLMAEAEFDYEWVMAQFSLLIAHQNPDIRRQTYFAIANVSEHIDGSTQRRLALFEQAIKLEVDASAKSSFFRATTILARKAPTLWPSVNVLLEKCLLKLEPLVLYEASLLLVSAKKGVPNDTVQLLMPYVKQVKADQKDILNNLTYFIVDKIKEGQDEVAESFLADLLIKVDGVSISDFQYLTHQLTNENSRVFLNKIASKWLLSEDVSLCTALFEVIGSINLNGIELEFDKTLLPLSDKESRFIARKVVGWFYYYPVSVISYLLSIIPYTSSEIESHIIELMLDPILLSFKGKGKAYLEEKLDNLDAKNREIVKKLLSDLEKYQSNISDSANAKELRAPQREVDIYCKDRDTKFSQSLEEVRKGSILELIGSNQVNILYGHDVVHHIHAGSETKRSINTMHSFSHSYEASQLSVIDPMGLDIMLICFRSERLNNETDT